MSSIVSIGAFTPHGEGSVEPLEKAEHAVLGMSAFNSYFSQQTINATLAAAHSHFSEVDVVVPGLEMTLMLEAGGMPPRKARAKVVKNINLLRGRVLAAFDELYVPRLKAIHRVHTFEDLAPNPVYAELSETVRRAFVDDEVFLKACLETSKGVLSRVGKHNTVPTHEQLVAAVYYFIGEAAVMTDSPGIFGHPTSVFCYHRLVEFAGPLFAGELSWTTAPGQGYAVVQPLKSS